MSKSSSPFRLRRFGHYCRIECCDIRAHVAEGHRYSTPQTLVFDPGVNRDVLLTRSKPELVGSHYGAFGRRDACPAAPTLPADGQSARRFRRRRQGVD